MRLINVVIAAALVIACASEFTVKNDPFWQSFKKSYGKSYENMDIETHRYMIFVKNMKRAAMFAESDPLATYGMTDFSDKEDHEVHGLLDVPDVHEDAVDIYVPNALPTTYDARNYGLVNSVRNQGGCGSCWAFAATTVIEAGYKKARGSLPSLSEQQMVDCDTGNSGCKGGWPTRAFNYVKSKGQMKRSDYPYTAVGGTCKYVASKKYATVKAVVNVKANAAQIMNAVYTYGTVAVAVDAAKYNAYTGGIMNGSNCAKKAPTHAVVVVGWGSASSVNYWLVRNSWGASWGESGYLRMSRGINACGIEDYPMVATVA